MNHDRQVFIVGTIILAAFGWMSCCSANAAEPDLAVRFADPPPGYGPVPLWWWVGEPLEKERLAWQLDRMKAGGVLNPCVIYSHAPDGSAELGEPPLFSKQWWDLFRWVLGECKKRGMTISFSDYTVINHAQSEVVRANPALGPSGFDPTRPGAGKALIDALYARFERECPGELGKTIGGWFQDELQLPGLQQFTETDHFREEFRRRKGYDLDHARANPGDKQPKIKIDYHDVIVTLAEENYFKPIYEWNEKYGLIFGHDQGGRESIIGGARHYGDYYRTMRWYSAPGYDDAGANPVGRRHFRDAKLASSIANLYRRPRVWCEAFHSSGWGVTPASLIAWLNENYAYGANLYDKHGLYYTTYGGWWEWAPPSAHFRQPYWIHCDHFSGYITRLSYLLSQGVHRCDVAILYPITTIHADVGATEAENAAWAIGHYLYTRGIDFDYVDHESIARAEVEDGRLRVSGNDYRALVFPHTAAVRHATLRKALELHRCGGLVIAHGCLPSITDRVGRNDPEVAAMVKEVFSGSVSKSAEHVKQRIDKGIVRDFVPSGSDVYVLHRQIDDYEVYFVMNIREMTVQLDAFFRAEGDPQLWDAWTGKISPIHRFAEAEQGTRLRLCFEPYEAKLLVFRPGPKRPAVVADNLHNVLSVAIDGDSATLVGTSRIAGEKTATVSFLGKTYRLHGKVGELHKPIVADGPWDFELVPTMHNRWGDFRLPPSDVLLGADTRRFRYADETDFNLTWQNADFDDSQWPTVTYSFGPQFWLLGPVQLAPEAERRLAGLRTVDPKVPFVDGDKTYRWQPYSFSRRWGIEGRAMWQRRLAGPHGFKQQVPPDFLRVPEENPGPYYFWTAALSPADKEAFLNTGSTGRCTVWLGGREVFSGHKGILEVTLRAGRNPLLVKLSGQGRPYGWRDRLRTHLRGYAVLSDRRPEITTVAEDIKKRLLGVRGYMIPGDKAAYDVRPPEAKRIGWYRFDAPPGLRSMAVVVRGELLGAWGDGARLSAEIGAARADGARCYTLSAESPLTRVSKIALRIAQPPGYYAGAAVVEPITFNCSMGKALTGAWKDIALPTYSGAAWYRRTVELTKKQTEQQLILNLGEVAATAKVLINGRQADIRIIPPYRVDISKFARPGENLIEVQVANTLANHFSVDIPSHYVMKGQRRSGLIGPVSIEVLSRVKLTNE